MCGDDCKPRVVDMHWVKGDLVKKGKTVYSEYDGQGNITKIEVVEDMDDEKRV